MKCSEIANLIPRYCAGELDDHTKKVIEEHLRSCAECRSELDREQTLRSAITGNSASDPPDDYWNDYNPRVRARLQGAFSLLWHEGCLTYLLIGLFLVSFGFLFWIGEITNLNIDLVVFIGYPAIVLFLTILWFLMHKRANAYIEDGWAFKELIRSDPMYRALFGVALILGKLILAGVFVAVWGWIWLGYLPRFIRYIWVGLAFITFAMSDLPWLSKYWSDNGLTVPTLPFSRHRAWGILQIGLMLFLLAWFQVTNHMRSEPWEALRLARHAMSAGDTSTAVSILKACAHSRHDVPRSLECYRELGDMYAKTGETDEAQEAYRQGITAYGEMLANPRFWYTEKDRGELLTEAATLYLRLGKREAAYQLYRNLLDLQPHDPENMHRVALGYQETGHYDEAFGLLTLLIIEHPRGIEAEMARDEIQIIRGRQAD